MPRRADPDDGRRGASLVSNGPVARAGYYRDLVVTLTIKEIKVRYKRTFLGYAWSLLNPIVYAVTYWIAFKAILNVRIEGYFVFLLCGLFPWQWLSNSLTSSPLAFVNNASLIKKISFPRYLIVLSTVLTEGLHFLLCLPVLAVIMVMFDRGAPHWSWLVGVPILLVLQAMIIFGISLAGPDCKRLVTLLRADIATQSCKRRLLTLFGNARVEQILKAAVHELRQIEEGQQIFAIEFGAAALLLCRLDHDVQILLEAFVIDASARLLQMLDRFLEIRLQTLLELRIEIQNLIVIPLDA